MQPAERLARQMATTLWADLSRLLDGAVQAGDLTV